MHIRGALDKDLSQIEAIYIHAKEFMNKCGNTKQWKDDYPSRESAARDIENKMLFVCEEGGQILAVFAFAKGEEETYLKIYEGAWKNDLPYAYIHRVAVKEPGRGIINFCFDFCFDAFSNLKIDTHKDNIPMQKALIRNGFEYCGKIYLKNGEERIAFQKTK